MALLAFLKIPALKTMAPTQSEPPFLVAHLRCSSLLVHQPAGCGFPEQVMQAEQDLKQKILL